MTHASFDLRYVFLVCFIYDVFDTSFFDRIFENHISRKRPRIGSGGSAFERSRQEESNELKNEALSLKGAKL